MNETVEVDRDYLWALEVLVCNRRPFAADIDTQTVLEAQRVVEGANLNRPRDR